MSACVVIIIAIGMFIPKSSKQFTMGQIEASTATIDDDLKPNLKPNLELNYKIIPVRLTCYLWTGSEMANGEYPEQGWVATSDRDIPFNTEIEIDGVIYKVGDRTNKRFDKELLTVDIYWEDTLESCLEFGVKYKDVKIYE